MNSSLWDKLLLSEDLAFIYSTSISEQSLCVWTFTMFAHREGHSVTGCCPHTETNPAKVNVLPEALWVSAIQPSLLPPPSSAPAEPLPFTFQWMNLKYSHICIRKRTNFPCFEIIDPSLLIFYNNTSSSKIVSRRFLKVALYVRH